MEITASHRDILRVIQADATITLDRLREQVALSQSTLWRRLKELEEGNVIRGRVTLLEPEEVGLSVCAFVSINLTSHIPKHRDVGRQHKTDHAVLLGYRYSRLHTANSNKGYEGV